MTESLVQELLLEINAHYETKLKAELITDTQMYMNFVKWVKRSFQRPSVKPDPLKTVTRKLIQA